MVSATATTDGDTTLLPPVCGASLASPPPDGKNMAFAAAIKPERVAPVAPSVSISSANNVVSATATTDGDTTLLPPIHGASLASPLPDGKNMAFTAAIKPERVAPVAPSVSISSANNVVSATAKTDGDTTLLPPVRGASSASPPPDGKNMAFAAAIKSEPSVSIISANNVVSVAATTDADTTSLSPVRAAYSNSSPRDIEHVASTAATPTFPSASVLSSGAKLDNVPHQQRYHQHPYPHNCLDGYIKELAQKYKFATSWGDFIWDVCGCSDLHPDVAHICHPAACMLSRFQKSGTPALLESDPWAPSWIKAALKQGPHRFCIQGIDFLREEYSDMIEKQQWIFLPAKMIQDMFGLQLSPLGLVPQQDCRD